MVESAHGVLKLNAMTVLRQKQQLIDNRGFHIAHSPFFDGMPFI
jgi:hypothetical protein